MATADTPAAAKRSTIERAQGASEFHGSTWCREMKRMIAKPTVKSAKAAVPNLQRIRLDMNRTANSWMV